MKIGHIGPNPRLGLGDVPARKLFVQLNLALDDTSSRFISMLPITRWVSLAARQLHCGLEYDNG